ncbi:hypothetical protein H072_962 [Dactylellina haptotyla CBS 200.50]|uniref:Uncharacterized protein n=1 Tax=Dactylellina haptotyla (strain CBS 200.50) TaxID=1284197 RepID=S8AVL8_DACHA|nr:hypothetical protein H072_962 [Dactylellina haptotyla CBS 200.50]
MSGPPQTSPHHPHNAPPGPLPNGHGPPMGPGGKPSASHQLSQLNEAVWLKIGSIAEMMGNMDGAMDAYEAALRQNTYSIPAMENISHILRTREQFPKAVEYLQAILNIDANNGDVWGSLGHCYLMMDDLQKAYQAYQQALYHLRDPKEPKLWYGIGILYDRYGSLEHAEEAFSQVMRMDPHFEKANEIYFRLGIIYKQQQKFQQSLDCFKFIVQDPPRPLTEEDIWFQIGHVHEQQKDFENAKKAYLRVLDRDPNHAKVLQQLGWLYHQRSGSYESQEIAIEHLEKSVRADNTDAQSWYLLGRCYMSQQKYPKAYEAYQQAVYRDGRNPTFWCSIGVLYYQINQYRDALDAYSRAIRLNPYISEVWYDLGTLYESCNNQINDALDAYQRAADLDPSNVHIKARLNLLRSGQASGVPHNSNAPPPAPLPQDVQQYQPAAPPSHSWLPQGTQRTQPPPPSHQGPPPPGPPGPNLAQLPPGGPGPAPSPYRGPDPMGPRPPSLRSPDIGSADPSRPPPPPPLHRYSPSPKIGHSAMYSGAPPPSSSQQGLPPSMQHHPQISQQMNGPQHGPPPPGPPNRILNPQHHSQQGPAPPPPPPPSHGQLNPPTNGNSAMGMTFHGTRGSPIPEMKPLGDRMPSPSSGFHSHSVHGQAHLQHQSGIASGAPAPTSAHQAADNARNDVRDRDPMKRPREWDDEASDPHPKKQASDITRERLESHMHHRSSPPRRNTTISPDVQGRRSSSERPREDFRGPPPPPSHHSTPGPRPMHQFPPMSESPAMQQPKRENTEIIEPPARQMDVDENYDDEPEGDDRRPSSASAPVKTEGAPKPVVNGDK